MHWVIQQSIFKPDNYKLLTNTLESMGVQYTSVSIPRGTYELEPNVDPMGKVYICGAIKMAKIAQGRGWMPGSFLNDQFRFDIWLKELGDELLNVDITTGKLSNIKPDQFTKFFIRPLEDNKAFDGMVIDNEILKDWCQDPTKSYLYNVDVVVSPVKKIYREYRIFVVNNRVITGSVYKVSGKPQISNLVESTVIEYANEIIKRWVPIESFVVDIGMTEHGLKVLEFNNINSSSFYASDVQKYVYAIQAEYS
ncbi:ATP-grasp domain-containing protein [Pantanalinema sp. GBBB05]|uniref:ATP-grasp domain-containing protein n=1 Tax=Pantanalinema sp. GBBB05 TaxID=2604139 RepID=UPI001D731659|nr:DUF4343 domain-containing protein [Pantanalinema sp. GBBB05]